MIVLLSYSTSWSKNDTDTISSTGVFTVYPDSVLIAFDDLRKANAKMVELKYQKEINDSLRSVVNTNNKIIRIYDNQVNELSQQVIYFKKQRNYAAGGGFFAALLLVITFIVK
ncbi:MAG: hypothetical protein IJG68_02060 [Bacilli bacterium]|nr:hypothetical protein [Bacilli bacterium]